MSTENKNKQEQNKGGQQDQWKTGQQGNRSQEQNKGGQHDQGKGGQGQHDQNRHREPEPMKK